ncbi:hypothetical protein PM082_011433 [Marasmius tenuissimus]|nr:hypothetical protein PM082_011433 [Marasmius tenuissimus]
MVKITPQPLILPTGKSACNGETKFSSKHLPEFILKNNGARKLFIPLCKEAASYVHGWSTLHKELLQGVVNRGWGEGQGNVKASDLHHELGTGALAVVESFIKQHWSDLPAPADPDEEIGWVFRNEEDVASWAAWQTMRFSVGSGPQLSPVLFATFVADEEGNVLKKKGMFKNELILRVLALYFAHVETILPNKWISSFPFGALELAIQAVERALVSYLTGRPAISGSFLYEDWGKKPVPDSKGWEKLKAMEFRKTIESLSEEKQQAIIAGAPAFVKAKGC